MWSGGIEVKRRWHVGFVSFLSFVSFVSFVWRPKRDTATAYHGMFNTKKYCSDINDQPSDSGVPSFETNLYQTKGGLAWSVWKSRTS